MFYSSAYDGTARTFSEDYLSSDLTYANIVVITGMSISESMGMILMSIDRFM